MTTIAEKPPARTGKCSLILSIDGRTYRLKRDKPLARNATTWRLTIAAGQTRAGLTYSVCTFNGKIDCTCPDSTRNFAACKHMQALRALGLVSRTARPTGLTTWELLHPETVKPRRARRVAAPIAAASPVAASGPDPLARARRRHQPTVGEASLAAALLGRSRTEAPANADPAAPPALHHTLPNNWNAGAQALAATTPPVTAAQFAAGFRAAVAEHTARLATGGVS